MTTQRGLNALLRKHSDLVLAAGVIAIIGLLIVRIPQTAMDFVIATNIAIGATVLLVALYIRDATKLPSFPTILLLTTLFRLAINVSTTRLILLETDAGQIIDAFGQFVVGGNFVVGGVIFLVLVLIQFIVIAKGSERVAEVSARFTLDAMPGKQMSIDADLRNGLLSQEDAKLRREGLERESKLYGAMDGAMKFVKGDAIAGICISIINIIGGLVVGVMQQGMTLAEAAEVYTLLTIGDGLVSQIPAILISVSAGLVVTRVAAGNDGDDSRVAGDIFDQVLAQPRALALVGILLALLGITGPWTGFPMAPFLIFGAIAGILAMPRGLAPAITGADGVGALGDSGALDLSESPEPPATPRAAIAPLVLELGSELERLFVDASSAERPNVREQLNRDIRQLSDLMGLPLPNVSIRIDNPSLQPTEYAVVVYDSPVARGVIAANQGLAFCDSAELNELGVAFEEVHVPWSRAMACAVTEDTFEKLAREDVSVLPAQRVIVNHLRTVVQRYAEDFLGIQEASDLVDDLRDRSPALAKAVIPTLLNLQQVTEVLKGLLRGQVPVRDLRLIIESLGRWAQNEKDITKLTELVRRDMRRSICTHFANGSPRLPFYSLDRTVIDTLRSAKVETSDGIVLDLGYDDQIAILEAIRETIDPTRHLDVPAVVLAPPDLRHLLADLLRPNAPEAVVMSYDELAMETAMGHELATVAM